MNNTSQENTTPLVDAAYYETVTTAIRGEAKRLLESGEVAAVIGYKAGRRKGSAQPVIINDAARTDELLFSAASVNNLSLYLTKAKKEVKKSGKIAIVAKGCDLKALAGLMGESQLKRENLHIIGIACAGVHGSGPAGRIMLVDLEKPVPAAAKVEAAVAEPAVNVAATEIRQLNRMRTAIARTGIRADKPLALCNG